MPASKSVIITLKAVVDDYQRAMARAAESTSLVGVAGSKLGMLAPSMTKLGDTLTRNVSLPLVGAGVAALKFGIDFDATFAKSVGLAGVAADEVEGLKQSVLDLASETGRGPQELAEALYFASSAGFDAAESMDIVTSSAHAAAAGLGSTSEVVNAVTNVLGAFGTEAISAGEVTDILVAAARDAKIEASELAPQLGRLLPSAKLLHVGFGDLAGAMAFLSQTSGDAALSATQLDTMLRTMLAPTEQGRKALASMGTSVEELHAAIDKRGLPGALDLLKEKFGGNAQALHELFNDAQGFAGANLLLTDTTGNLAKALQDTNNAAGATADAFAKTDGSSRDMQRAWADIQVALIQLGETLAPLGSSFAGFFGDLASGFASLPGPAQTFVAILGLVAASAGPLASLSGRITTTRVELEKMGGAGRAASSGIGAVTKGLGLLTAAFIAVEAGQAVYSSFLEEAKPDLDHLGLALVDFGQRGVIAGALAETFGDDLSGLAANVKRIRSDGAFDIDIFDDAHESVANVDQVDKALQKLVDTGHRADAEAIFKKLVDTSGVDPEKLKAELNDYSDALARADTEQKLAGDGAKDKLAPGLDAAAAAADSSKEAIDKFKTSLDELFQQMFGVEDAQDALQQKLNDLPDVLRRASEEGANLGDVMGDTSTGSIGLRDHMRGLATDALSVIDEWRKQGVVGQTLTDRIALMSLSIRDQALAWGVPAPVVDHYLTLLGNIPAVVSTEVTTPGIDAAIERLAAFNRMVAATPTGIDVNFGTGGGATFRRWGGVDYFAGGGSRQAGIATRPTVFGEHETGGEAFIPRYGNQERSLGILATAASWYGYQVSGGASMSATPAPSQFAGATAAPGAVTHIYAPNITVEIKPGVYDRAAIGKEVVEAISAHEQRNGSSWRKRP